MAIQQEIGQKGEELACSYLQSLEYVILERNWRFGRAEVDIIAKDRNVLVFVEVKARTSDYFGAPASFVTPKKEAFLSHAAAAYMDKIGHDWELRFDIISILFDKKNHSLYQIEHFKDAFF